MTDEETKAHRRARRAQCLLTSEGQDWSVTSGRLAPAPLGCSTCRGSEQDPRGCLPGVMVSALLGGGWGGASGKKRAQRKTRERSTLVEQGGAHWPE